MCAIALLFTYIQVNLAAPPIEAELVEARDWISAKFEGMVSSPEISRIGAVEVIANHDPVQQNARAGKSLRIGNEEFTRGLYCHAPSKLRIRLPSPGKTFEATIGIDSNDQTSGGRGSVEFTFVLNGQAIWKSGTVREGVPPKVVRVDLNGALEFVLEVTDAGDDISCDQSDWADARVTLEDGSVLWLGDLPIMGQQRLPYSTLPVFSFSYDGKPSSDFLPQWEKRIESRALDGKRTEYTLTYTDPKTRLQVQCVGIGYGDFPTVEWTLYFKNTGTIDTPVLNDIQAIDTVFDRNIVGEYTLHHNKGDNCTADSFEPQTTPLGPNAEFRVANTGGRPTQIEFPYFNVGTHDEGLIIVVSWAGQWSAQFTRDAKNGLRVRAGQEHTHFRLHPGENIRTPLIVLQFWKGDWWRAQNVWRSWMIEHNLPRPGGNLPPLPQLAACSSHQFGEMIHANTGSQIFFVEKYLERGIKLDYWWMDAGWYPNETGWPNTGTWEVDRRRFPNGLREITDFAHANGVKSIVWFEPERVTANTWITNNHPEWVYGGKEGGLLRLGEPAVREWLIDRVDGLLTSEGIDLYRQDFNMDPLPFWRANDAEDRQGITEIRHVEGYYAYWDALRSRHPDMLIDSCASGGRRNDLETLRRAVPLLRSDYIMEPIGNQCHTYALSAWLPFYGTGTSKTDPYLVRSVLCPHFTACWDMRDETLDYSMLKRIVDQWREFGKFYFGDFYPLTEYSLSDHQWLGWQFHRQAENDGLIQVFRRSNSPYVSARLTLSGMDRSTRYVVTNIDSPSEILEVDGNELSTEGLLVRIHEKPGTACLVYRPQ